MKKETYKKDLSIRSEVITAVIEKPPRTIIRYGMLVLLFILSSFVFFLSVFRTDNSINLEVVDQEVIAPKLRMQNDGVIKEVIVQDHEHVNANQALVKIDSAQLIAPDTGQIAYTSLLFPRKRVKTDSLIGYLVADDSHLLLLVQTKDEEDWTKGESIHLSASHNRGFQAEVLAVKQLTNKKQTEIALRIDLNQFEEEAAMNLQELIHVEVLSIKEKPQSLLANIFPNA